MNTGLSRSHKTEIRSWFLQIPSYLFHGSWFIPLRWRLRRHRTRNYGHVARKSCCPKVMLPEVMLPETRVMLPEILCHVAQNLRKKILKNANGLKTKSDWNVKLLFSQQRGPGHLGLTLQGNMQRTTNPFFLWSLQQERVPKLKWLPSSVAFTYKVFRSKLTEAVS